MTSQRTSSILSYCPLLAAVSAAAVFLVGCNEPAPTAPGEVSQDAIAADETGEVATLTLEGGVAVGVAALRDGASLAPLSSLHVGAGVALEIDVSAEALASIKGASGGVWRLALKGKGYELVGVRIVGLPQPPLGGATQYFTIKFQPETVRYSLIVDPA